MWYDHTNDVLIAMPPCGETVVVRRRNNGNDFDYDLIPTIGYVVYSSPTSCVVTLYDSAEELYITMDMTTTANEHRRVRLFPYNQQFLDECQKFNQFYLKINDIFKKHQLYSDVINEIYVAIRDNLKF